MKLLLKIVGISAFLLSVGQNAIAETALKGLYLTSPGFHHDYPSQAKTMQTLMAENLGMRLDVSLSELERWKTTDFAEGYDLLVLNFCEGNNTDAALIRNMRRQIEALKVPTIALHCVMHSFRDTPDWWPVLGLRTYKHDEQGDMSVQKQEPHIVTEGLPETWTIEDDELYVNLKFDGLPLLRATGDDGKEHVVAWWYEAKGYKLFGTTLGHTDSTFTDPNYQQLLVNAARHLIAPERIDGAVERPIAEAKFSAPDGVRFMTDGERSCHYRTAVKLIGPCYVGCIVNPFHWGEDTARCKESCLAQLPENQVIESACSENTTGSI